MAKTDPVRAKLGPAMAKTNPFSNRPIWCAERLAGRFDTSLFGGIREIRDKRWQVSMKSLQSGTEFENNCLAPVVIRELRRAVKRFGENCSLGPRRFLLWARDLVENSSKELRL